MLSKLSKERVKKMTYFAHFVWVLRKCSNQQGINWKGKFWEKKDIHVHFLCWEPNKVEAFMVTK